MPTATDNSNSPLPEKADENGTEKKARSLLEIVPATNADYLEVVAQATNDAIRDWDVANGTLTWPRGLENALGYTNPDECGDLGFWLLRLHPDDRPRIQESLRQTFGSTADRWEGEYRFRHADGEYRNILDRAVILRDHAGAAVRLAGPMMDVSRRKQLQAQACRSQRMEAFGQLAGGVAHDFNNFLTTILGYSDLLLSDGSVKGRVAGHIKEIRAAAHRASSLTNQLLAFSRRQALEPTVFEINGFITNLERSLLRLLGDHISIECHLHSLREGAHLKVDAGQLTQILLNLAVNARDAMPEGGRLTITLSSVFLEPNAKISPAATSALPVGEYVVIAVSDNGRGMTDEVKTHLFEPFFTTKEAHNSGLGLATSYGIVKQSGGDILVESVEGQGTTFRILLPRVAAPPAARYKRSPRRNFVGTETVLVLEDETSVRHLAVRVLRELGYEVLEAAHGEDAKRFLASSGAPKVDLLLADMVMPEISGRHFADWLRQTSPQTKVIFISGYLTESLHPHDRGEPDMHFLAKPFDAGTLASKVRKVLDEKTPD